MFTFFSKADLDYDDVIVSMDLGVLIKQFRMGAGANEAQFISSDGVDQ